MNAKFAKTILMVGMTAAQAVEAGDLTLGEALHFVTRISDALEVGHYATLLDIARAADQRGAKTLGLAIRALSPFH